MAQLKSTSVTGNLSVTGNVVASQIIKLDGTNKHLLAADGSVYDLDNFTSGIKFSGDVLLTENSSSIITRSALDEWTAGIYSNTSGDEILGILVKNPMTHIMLGLGDAKARPAATNLTPAIDIKNNKVGINKRLGKDGQADAGSYNLDVNGSLNTVSMTLDTSATFTYNSTDKCIDVLFT